jgi:hypothetical protein
MLTAALTHGRNEFDFRLEPFPAIRADQQVIFQRTHFRFGESLHGISLQRITGDVLHDFNGSLFLGEIGCAGITSWPLIATFVAGTLVSACVGSSQVQEGWSSASTRENFGSMKGFQLTGGADL